MTEEQILERLNSPDNLANKYGPREVIPTPEPKRGVGMPLGQKILPTFIKDTIAIMDRTGVDTQKAIGSEFGVTQVAVSNINTGRTHHNVAKTNRQLEVLKDLALEKLMTTLGLIKEEKLSEAKPVELSKIAQNLSGVVRITLPKEEALTAPSNITLTVYAPQIAKESDFQIIEV